MSDTGGGIGDYGNWFSGLVGLFKGVGQKVAQALSSIATQLYTVSKGMAVFGQRVGGLFARTAGLFNVVWRHAIRPLVVEFLIRIAQLAVLLRRWFGPVIAYIAKKRKWFIDHYNHFVRPVLDTIDVIRGTLRVLGLVGVDSAKALDRKLAQVEQKILEPMFVIVRKMNEISDWVNRIMTADGVFQQVALLISVNRYKREIFGVGVAAISRPLTSAEEDALNSPYPAKPIGQHVDDLERAFDGRESYVRERAVKYIDAYNDLAA